MNTGTTRQPDKRRRESRRKWAGVAVLCVALLFDGMSIASINVQVPPIREELGLSGSSLQFVVTSYLMFFAGFLLLGGRAADLLGRRRVFMAGIALFGLASLGAGLSTGAVTLVVARCLQGVGAAITAPAAISIITNMFPEGPERNKALGIYGAVGSGGFAMGVVVAGLLTSFSWRWGFFMYVPIAVLVLILTPLLIERYDRQVRTIRDYDVVGAVTVTVGLLALVYAIGQSTTDATSTTAALFVVAIVLLSAFVVIERRARAPLLPLEIFRLTSLRNANIVVFTFFGGVAIMNYIVALYLQETGGYSPLKAGLAFLPDGIVGAVVSPFAGWFVSRFGIQRTLAIALVLMAGGLLSFARFDAQVQYLGIILPGTLLVGIGIGLALPVVVMAAVAGVRNDDQGLASSLVTTSMQAGGAIGIAASAAVVTLGSAAVFGAQSGPDRADQALLVGFQLAMLLAAGFAVAALLIVLIVLREPRASNKAST